MPVRKGKCINFGLCPKADSREIITVNDGEEFSCPFPDCRKPLQPLTTPPPPAPSPWLVIGSIIAILAIIVTVLLRHPWHKSVSVEPSGPPPVAAPPPEAKVPDLCIQTDWAKADANAFLSIDCKGRGIAAYDKRVAYIASLKATNWTNVKSNDPRLRDCAGLHACEDRARIHPPPPPTCKPGEESCISRDWSKASCEEVKEAWQGEDPRLSTPTCGGLSKSSCSHIQRCLGLHPLNVGPGNSPD